MITPIQKLSGRYNDNSIYVKRDDLLPFSFGGSKVRIAYEFFEDMVDKGADCMVAYGNARSNLCRVLSNLCCAHHYPCIVISPDDDNGSRITTNNSIMCDTCYAQYVFCSKKHVADTVQKTLDESIKRGLKPYYIYGDQYGNGNKDIPVKAYAKVYREISRQLHDLNIHIDYIFLATGTGMTQAGLLLGKKQISGQEKIVGISVAREPKTVVKKLKEYIDASAQTEIQNEEFNVYKSDAYQEYGQYGIPIVQEIAEILQNEGIAIYTGKAFWGMREYLKRRNIKNKNILFIHTGGTPLYFDLLQATELKMDFFLRKIEKTEESQDKLKDFVKNCSNEFAVPLMQRINVEDYVSKILTRGYVFAVVDNQEHIEGAVCGYANDYDNRTAFESLLVVKKHLRGTKAAKYLFEMQLQYCKNQGMDKIKFSTNKGNVAAQKFYEKNHIPVVRKNLNENQIYYELQL